MSVINTQLNLTTESYAERAQLVRNLRDECARAERGGEIDLHQTAAKLNGLVHALKTDLIAMGRTNVSRELHNQIQTHKKDLTGLTVRVNNLSEKASSVPTWMKPVAYTALAVGGLALTAIAASRFASTTDTSSYGGSYGGYEGVTASTTTSIDDKGPLGGTCTLKGTQGGQLIVPEGSRVVSRDWELFVTPWGTCSNRPQGGAVIVREGSKVVSRDWELFVKSESPGSYLQDVGMNFLYSTVPYLIDEAGVGLTAVGRKSRDAYIAGRDSHAVEQLGNAVSAIKNTIVENPRASAAFALTALVIGAIVVKNRCFGGNENKAAILDDVVGDRDRVVIEEQPFIGQLPAAKGEVAPLAIVPRRVVELGQFTDQRGEFLQVMTDFSKAFRSMFMQGRGVGDRDLVPFHFEGQLRAQEGVDRNAFWELQAQYQTERAALDAINLETDALIATIERNARVRAEASALSDGDGFLSANEGG